MSEIHYSNSLLHLPPPPQDGPKLKWTEGGISSEGLHAAPRKSWPKVPMPGTDDTATCGAAEPEAAVDREAALRERRRLLAVPRPRLPVEERMLVAFERGAVPAPPPSTAPTLYLGSDYIFT